MARPPRLDPRDVHRAPEIAAVLGLGAPARLAGSLAGGSASWRPAVMLVPPATWVRSKQLVTALALAAISTGHGVPSREDAPSAHAHRSPIPTSANAPPRGFAFSPPSTDRPHAAPIAKSHRWF